MDDKRKIEEQNEDALSQALQEKLDAQEEFILEQQLLIEQLQQENQILRDSFESLENAILWRMMKPIRFLVHFLKWLARPKAEDSVMRNFPYIVRVHGWRFASCRINDEIFAVANNYDGEKQALFDEQELAAQRERVFPQQITFSVVVPLYNTPERFLREMIASVRSQTYADWELCLADGSDEKHADVERVCREYVQQDSRIRYRKLEKNLGISGNTNACLEMAQGDYIGLFDHDDLLHPAALHEVMRAICEKHADFIYTDESTFRETPKDAYLPHFKPSFAPDNLRAGNYICHFTVFKRSLLDEVGRFDPACDGSQDHDMILRLTERAEHIAHIPEILYYWRAHAGSVAESTGVKPYVIAAGIRAVTKQLERLGLEGSVEQIKSEMALYRIRYAIKGTPKVSILIPNYEHLEDLKTCVDSIYGKTSWPNFEIVIVENNSKSPELFAYYEELQRAHENLRVVTWEGAFNFSAINNYGARFCGGEYLLLLNNDTEVITPDWIQEMLMFAQRSDVGAVGAKLYYFDDTIQHAGVCLGMGGVASHYYQNTNRKSTGYMGRLLYAQNVSAVTGACMLLRREVWDEMQGLDEGLAVAYNDVDLCMRIRQAGRLIVWTPFAELYHYESKSRGREDTPEKRKRFNAETIRFRLRWKKEMAQGDPYYNPNLALNRTDSSVTVELKQHEAR